MTWTPKTPDSVCAASFAVALLLAAVSAAQDAPVAPRDSVADAATIPTAVIPGAIEHLKTRVGVRFYRECITLKSSPPLWIVNPVPEDYSSREPRMVGGWYVLFTLAMPSKPFVRGLVTVIVDSAGVPLESFDITGIGRCVEHPEECSFPIDEQDAIEIARREGLDEGIAPWRAGFGWHREGFYLWTVSNTSHIGGDGCNKNGHMISIDATTGAVYAKSMWRQICCGQ